MKKNLNISSTLKAGRVKFFSLACLFLGIISAPSASAQCTTGPSLGTLTVTPTAQVIAVAAGAPAYRSFNAVSGGVYTFTYCSNGGNYTGDPYLTVSDNAPVALQANDDFCGLGSNLVWTAPSTGTFRLYFSGCCPCANAPTANLAYLCTNCGAPPPPPPPPPSCTLNAGPDQTICSGSSFQMNPVLTGGQGNETYSWLPAAGLSNPNIRNPLASPTVTTTYTVTAAGPGGGGPVATTFNFTGGQQTYTVPAGVTSVNIQAWGAEGGSAPNNQGSCGNLNMGGDGGFSSGDLVVTPGQQLIVFVGGRGFNGQGPGGFNGGGTSLNSDNATSSSGGGGSDVRAGGAGLNNRVIVGGGGGGAEWSGRCLQAGQGGGLTGGVNAGGDNVGSSGGAGTQNAGGAGGFNPCAAGFPPPLNRNPDPGVFGIGGQAGGFHSGAGGGGWFGGGGGGCDGHGGGGSGYIAGVTGGVTTPGQRTGNGQVIITTNVAASCSASDIITINVSPRPTLSCNNITVNLDATGNASISGPQVYSLQNQGGGGGGPPVVQLFAFTGGAQSFTVPTGVTSIFIEAWGAEGGFAPNNLQVPGFGGMGGDGGFSSGNLAVAGGQVLQVNVGGRGFDGQGPGGFNGGGSSLNSDNATSSSGGGGSDVRAGGNALNNRVIVAGGGGGAEWSGRGQQAGGGGGLQGVFNGGGDSPANDGLPGTQNAGGNVGPNPCANGFPPPLNRTGNPGVFGAGGEAGGFHSGAGGGGWFGGGAGGCDGHGAGGSGYIAGVTGGVTLANQRTGNGQVRITYSAPAPPCGVRVTLSDSLFNCADFGNNTVVVTATDAGGGTQTCNAIVTVDDNTAPVARCQNITRNAPSTGSVTITAQDIDNGSSDNCAITLTLDRTTFDCGNVGPNTVTLTADDNHAPGNMGTCTAVVTITTDPLVTTLSSPTFVCGYNVTCNGASDGSISSATIGGCEAYSYRWSTGDVTSSISGLAAGTYTLTVTDRNQGQTVSSITLTQPDVLALATSTTNVLCFGACDGSATLTANGGAACQDYNYVLSGPTASAGQFSGSTTISNLCAGAYTADVSDANGCAVSMSFTITEPALLVATPCASTQWVTKCYARERSAQITVGTTGGTAPYTYSWSNGETTSDIIVSPTANTVYTLTVTDANGCTATASSEIKVVDDCCLGSKGLANGKIIICDNNGSKGPQEKCVNEKDVLKKLCKPGYTIGPCAFQRSLDNQACGEPDYFSCDCDGGLSCATFTYNGVSGANITVWADAKHTISLGTWTNVANGQTITFCGIAPAKASKACITGGRNILPGKVYVGGLGGSKDITLKTGCGSNTKASKLCGSKKGSKNQPFALTGWVDGTGAICNVVCPTLKAGTPAANVGGDMVQRIGMEAFPNPFKSATTLRIALTQDDQISLQVYNLTGELIATVFNGEVEANKSYDFEFAPANVADGVYLAKVTTGSGETKFIRLILAK